MLSRLTVTGKVKVLVIVLLFIVCRIPGGDSEMLNSDGARWHRRSEKFLTAIKTGDFASTYQHYQPGVTLMWINAATKQITWAAQDTFKVPRWSLENATDFPKIHAISETILVLVLSIIFLYQLMLVIKLTGPKTALLYGLLIATEPYLIGIDRWFHLTSLESYLAFSAYLTYLYSFTKQSKKVYIGTGALIALATLSKLTAAVVLPLILVTEILHAVYAKNIQRGLISILLILGSFGVVFVALFPALWVNFFDVVIKLVTAASSAVENDVREQYFNFPLSFVYYPIILGYKLSPLTLMTFGVSLTLAIRSISGKGNGLSRMLPAYFLAFFLTLTLSAKKIDRYSLSMFQPLILFICIYLTNFKTKMLVIFIAFQLIVSGCIYYLNSQALSGYYSPILGGAETALRLGVYENSGEYFAQAALYLNNKGRVDVYVPDNYDAFKYYYKGVTTQDLSMATKYVVTSVDFDRKLPRLINGCTELEKTFGSKYSLPAVYIFSCSLYR
jgi:hypothetical protein